MGTITTATILKNVQLLLQDSSNVRWSQDELIGWLNDGQRESVIIRPQVNVKNQQVLLSAGKTKQTIPSDGVMLIDITRNSGADGNTVGEAIRMVSRESLDAMLPTWHSDTNAIGKIRHFVFDERDPKTYYVFPKAPATTWYVDLVYSAVPADCTLSGTIGIDDIYANAMVDYVMYRAYSKDSENPQNRESALMHYRAFAFGLGAKSQNEGAQKPTTQLTDGG